MTVRCGIVCSLLSLCGVRGPSARGLSMRRLCAFAFCMLGLCALGIQERLAQAAPPAKTVQSPADSTAARETDARHEAAQAAAQQSADQRTVDSLRAALHAAHGEARVKLLHEIGEHHYTRSNLDSALYYFEAALVVAEESLSEAPRHDEAGPDGARVHDDEVVDLLASIGNVHYLQGEYERALQQYLEALQRLEALPSVEAAQQRARMLSNIGNVYYIQEDYEAAYTHYARSLSIGERLGDDTVTARASIKMAYALRQQRRYAEAIQQAQRGLALSRAVGNLDLETRAQIALAHVHDERGAPDEALAMARQALANARHLQYIPYQTAALDLLATAHAQLGRADASIAYAQQSIATARQSGVLNTVVASTRFLAEQYAHQGAYAKAYATMQRHRALKDSLEGEARAEALAVLRTKYEAEQMEQELALQDLRMQRQHVLLIGGSVGLLLLLLLAGALYHNVRLKAQANQMLDLRRREIEQQKNNLAALVEEKDVLLDERETLMREIHHRVKNNFQIVSSLLALQADPLEDEATLALTRQFQSRVMAMALVHQKLYQTEGLSHIDARAYIEDLTGFLFRSFCSGSVQHTVDAEPVSLSIDTAVPLGLILSELVSNACEHAFPDGRPGHVHVILQRVQSSATGQGDGPAAPTDTFTLIVADDGVGFAPEPNAARNATLGLSLVYDLARQLRGHVAIEGHPGEGARFAVTFQPVSRPPLHATAVVQPAQA